MKIINGENAILGRLASYAAKQALKGEEIVIVNCDKVVITGNKENILRNFKEKRSKVGNSQTGLKYSLSEEKIVKRTIRGMLPDHRVGRGKEVLKKIMCYKGIPKQYEDKKKIAAGKEKGIKLTKLSDL